jgi:hypothetical protein
MTHCSRSTRRPNYSAPVHASPAASSRNDASASSTSAGTSDAMEALIVREVYATSGNDPDDDPDDDAAGVLAPVG